MTWGECKDITLRKMFASSGGAINLSESGNKDYLAAMPSAANEGIERLVGRDGRARRERSEFRVDGTAVAYDVKSITVRFKSFGGDPEVYLLEDGKIAPVAGAAAVGDEWLVLPEETKGECILYYDARPRHIDHDTADEDEIDLPEDQAILLPLYMAGELYKDDDISLATMYMNEFEAKLSALTPKSKGMKGGEFTSVTGWW